MKKLLLIIFLFAINPEVVEAREWPKNKKEYGAAKDQKKRLRQQKKALRKLGLYSMKVEASYPS